MSDRWGATASPERPRRRGPRPAPRPTRLLVLRPVRAEGGVCFTGDTGRDNTLVRELIGLQDASVDPNAIGQAALARIVQSAFSSSRRVRIDVRTDLDPID